MTEQGKRKEVLCRECGQPMLPKGTKKLPNEYDHAQGCPNAPKKQAFPICPKCGKKVTVDWEVHEEECKAEAASPTAGLTLGDFVNKTLLMWEQAANDPAMAGVRFDIAEEILRNTYSVKEMRANAPDPFCPVCLGSLPCERHTPPKEPTGLEPVVAPPSAGPQLSIAQKAKLAVYEAHRVAEGAASLETPMEKDRNRWRRALSDLTPGGSEFADDPERCKQFVRDARDSQHKAIVKFKLAKDAAERAAAQARKEAFRECAEICGSLLARYETDSCLMLRGPADAIQDVILAIKEKEKNNGSPATA